MSVRPTSSVTSNSPTSSLSSCLIDLWANTAPQLPKIATPTINGWPLTGIRRRVSMPSRSASLPAVRTLMHVAIRSPRATSSTLASTPSSSAVFMLRNTNNRLLGQRPMPLPPHCWWRRLSCSSHFGATRSRSSTRRPSRPAYTATV